MTDKVGEAADEGVIDPFVDVEALDATARLPAIEKHPVDQVLDGEVQIGIGAHVGRVLAAQFQPDTDETAMGGGLDHFAAADRAGKGDEIDLGGPDHLRRRWVVEMQELKDACW